MTCAFKRFYKQRVSRRIKPKVEQESSANTRTRSRLGHQRDLYCKVAGWTGRGIDGHVIKVKILNHNVKKVRCINSFNYHVAVGVKESRVTIVQPKVIAACCTCCSNAFSKSSLKATITRSNEIVDSNRVFQTDFAVAVCISTTKCSRHTSTTPGKGLLFVQKLHRTGLCFHNGRCRHTCGSVTSTATASTSTIKNSQWNLACFERSVWLPNRLWITRRVIKQLYCNSCQGCKPWGNSSEYNFRNSKPRTTSLDVASLDDSSKYNLITVFRNACFQVNCTSVCRNRVPHF